MNYEHFVNEPLGVVVVKMDRDSFAREVYNVSMAKLVRKYNNSKISTGDKSWGDDLENYVWAVYRNWTKKNITEKSYTTRAKCNYEDGDVFDPQIGYYIAADRMDMKITQYAYRFLVEFTDVWSDFCMDLFYHGKELLDYYDTTEANIMSLVD